jgi:hypothetical protein
MGTVWESLLTYVVKHDCVYNANINPLKHSGNYVYHLI